MNASVRHTNIIFIDYNITKYADMQSNVSDTVIHKGKLKRPEKDTLYTWRIIFVKQEKVSALRDMLTVLPPLREFLKGKPAGQKELNTW